MQAYRRWIDCIVRDRTARVLWCLSWFGCAAVSGQDSGAKSVLRSGDLSVSWVAREGVTISYRGVPAFVPLAQSFTVHPPDWSTAFYRSSDHVPAVVRHDTGDVSSLVCTYPDAGLRLVETVIVGPGDRCRLEYSYRQDRWDDARLQLGLPRPGRDFWEGSHFLAKQITGDVQGLIPLAYDPAVGQHPFSATTDISVYSVSGRLQVTADKPLILWDYPGRPEGFFLGLDEPLPRGETVRFGVTLLFEPPHFEQAGITVQRLSVPSIVRDGVLTVALQLSDAAANPQALTVEVALLNDDGTAHACQQTVQLTAELQDVRLVLPVSEGGHYRCRVRLVDAAGREPIVLPLSNVDVVPLLRIRPTQLPMMESVSAAMLARLSPGLVGRSFTFSARSGGTVLQSGWETVAVTHPVRIPVDLTALPDGRHTVWCALGDGETILATASTEIVKAAPKANAVVIDYESRGLMVDGLPFFPFGFYCVFPMGDLPEVEAVQGFTHIAPYQSQVDGHSDAVIADIKAYMDRCAALGLKVHYDVRLLAQAAPSPEKWVRLRREIETFRDHPALLCWYLCDEPAGQGIEAAVLDEAYAFVKDLDPYHPVTMVFCVPQRAKDYMRGMDIMMADPYPIPNRAITMVSDWADDLNRAVDYGMPLWIVPQAFGGGEGWGREPSVREERAMTYLALTHGATGIQYFVRRAPIGNPISPSLWSECRRLSLEVAELTPWLLSAEPTPAVTVSPPSVHGTTRTSNGDLLLLAVNSETFPRSVTYQLDGATTSGLAEVVFEDRTVEVQAGRIVDLIDGFGTRVYRLPAGPGRADDEGVLPGNLTRNPSFEDAVNAGTPDGCYVSVGADPGASLFVDSRVARHGRRSLRVTTPREGGGLTIRPFPVRLEKGQRYRLTVWSKASSGKPEFDMAVTGLDVVPLQVSPATEWRESTLVGVCPETLGRGGIELRFRGAGVVWIDLLQLVAVPAE